MATKKKALKKASTGKNPVIVADSPVTVGGGGLIKLGLPVVIQFIPADWIYDLAAGTLTLRNGINCRKVKVSTEDVDIKIPLTGSVNIELKFTKTS